MDEQGEPDPGARAARRLEDFLARVAPPPQDLTADLDAATVEVFEAFEAAAIDAMLLKGPALARALYTTGERRTYSDVDVLVAPPDLARARETLRRLGYRNSSEIHGIDDVAGVVHEESWVGTGPASEHELLVELHLRLAGARVSPEAAWEALAEGRDSIDLGGRRIPVPGRAGLAMHLALHAAQHGPGYPKGCRELELGLGRWSHETWHRAARLAEEMSATETFAAGLRLVAAGAALAERLGLPASGRLDWEVGHADARPRGTFHLGALVEAEGLRSRADVLRRSLLPSRRWIAWQYPWARAGGARLLAAYVAHLIRAPALAVRAWRFRRRARRSG